MPRIKTSLSVALGIICLYSFRFVGPSNTNDLSTKSPDNRMQAVENCEHETIEYCYTSSNRFKQLSDSLYVKIFTASNRPKKKVFEYALRGYATLIGQDMIGKKNILAFIDYSLSANQKRFWVLDLKNLNVLYHELVAHGRNTGEEFARKFSNKNNSFQSSLGFFITGEIYTGKHELSIRMNGVENRYNGKAYDRGIVIHGADYVSDDYIRQNRRLGRSLGCPAVSETVIESLSNTISEGACLFSYYPNNAYLKSSKLLKKNVLFAHAINTL